MKLKTPWFTIDIKPVKHVKPYKPWRGSYCDVCGDKIPGAEKAKHLRECHPQYDFEMVRGSCRCNVPTCGKSVGTVGNIVKHYQEKHPELLTPRITDAAEVTGIVDEGILDTK
jgi:hypothetical protein